MKNVRVKSVIPIYATGVVFFLYAVFMPMYRIWDPILALAAAVAGYFIFNKLFPGKTIEVELTYDTGDKSVDQILTQGRGYVIQLDEFKNAIQDEDVSRRIGNLQDISRQIFDYISKNPAQVRKIRRFMDYYYPTVLKFLEHYAEYDSKNVKGENLRNTLEKIRESLSQFEEAFAHQLDNLYGDKALDIETDIEVLQNMMKMEGL